MTDTPRIMVVSDSTDFQQVHLSEEFPYLQHAVLFSPFIESKYSWREVAPQELLFTWFEKSNDRFLKLLKVFKPYCIIAQPNAFSSIENFYSINDGIVNINDEEYPIFTVKEANNEIGIIEKYCRSPYRGKDINRVFKI